MKKIIAKLAFSALAILLAAHLKAQQTSAKNIFVQMHPDNWQYDPGTVRFEKVDGQLAMKITDARHMATVKDASLTDGIIEFDIQLPSEGFSTVYFRRQSTNEAECFYFRTGKGRNGQAGDALQYAPIIKGINLWDLYPQYQSDASIQPGKWNHVKAVISGKQLRVFVNDTTRPALIVPYLEGNVRGGSVAFDGAATIANLTIRRGATDGLFSLAGADITDNDPRYLRNWQVKQKMTSMQPGIGLDNSDMPDSNTLWEPIRAERRGLINLSRKFGGDQKRKIVWLKTHIQADANLTRRLLLGISDEVWVFINGQLLYVDKNYFNTPTMKTPGGRISLENASFDLPLKKGQNEILIGVANAFYGWGIIARLDDSKGLLLER
ncbi:family 16 glycoside hydrolase [Arachidicoccus terrestris]|uniref:family 16 glycoside hydrolase n=1 Tax=Arachidicoccus terrestris TaxID=2875539 RepID=UPI001CC3C467|nr:family 16 glycoside hydrolase [Arachidicoccus terrestris]UAY57129.1 DUF1080 domain-containing protein [Arachidicoccus terrestris]